MKKCLIILVLLILANPATFIYGSDQKADQEQMMKQLKKEVFANLTGNLLPYWSKNMVDDVNGGFYGRIDGNNKVHPEDDKGGILNARILWTYSSAYRIFKDTAYLRLATRAKDYILAHFIDKQYGGAYRSVTAKGEPSDTRNWKRSHDLLIGESTINDEKTMNTHLHLMEAYTNLYRAWPDKRMAVRLRNMVNLFLDHIIDNKTYHLVNFMDRNWKRTSMVDSYGHDIESSWLLYEAASLLGDRDLIARVKEVSIKIADAASQGIQPDGSLVYEKDQATGHVNTDRSWWPQSEAIVGYLNAFKLTGNQKYLDRSVNCWNYTKEHLIDYKNGGWFSDISGSGVVSGGDKAGFWVCPYHDGRMCMEVCERVSLH